MQMESNLNFRGARIVKAISTVAVHPTNAEDSAITISFKSLHRASTLEVWMSIEEAQKLAAELVKLAWGENGNV